ncbi:response regulator transcription factor [Pseudomonas aeruginosa]|uniref:response regulator transcription factor n=1 Tax=Pseudomonas aeruginosa TaxID=287 RepID=UPI001F5BDE3F|nr:response regulator transcription factor [Pseudomonas aeruginosa]UJT96790.1 response regulator transcription factor [Pseudomonas aeruginosa]
MEHVDHILIVDDDREIRELVGNYLKKNGLRTTIVADGRQMRAFLEANTVDLIVLDIMMPGDDGLLLCRELRVGKHKATPVLMLTARNDETDRIIGLEMGADDYLTKPFDLDELQARVRALTRRTTGRALPQLVHGELRLDPATHQVTLSGQAVELAPREYALLRLLLENSGKVLSRNQLEQSLYGWSGDVESNAIEVHVHHLRRKLGNAIVQTVRGLGYRLGPARGDGDDA